MAAVEVFWVFLKLGLTSFGGPVAHLGYFHKEFVGSRRWLSDRAYLDLVALCQFLPGPASSQVGIAVGLSRAGYLGAFAAWLGFTLPSALILVLFAYGLANFSSKFSDATLHGLKIAAVAVVAHAIWSMGTRLCPDKNRMTAAVAAATLTSLIPSSLGQIVAILLGAVFGWYYLTGGLVVAHEPIQERISKRAGLVSLTVFLVVASVLPFFLFIDGGHLLKLFDSFFRTGSLVFGGGHVVLPLLQAEVVSKGFVTADAFMAGYGAAQAIPGPLFAFAAYLGAVSWGLLGAIVALVAIFLPSFFLVIGVLPFWDHLRKLRRVRSAMMGVNAAVVGLLLAAFYDPVWTNAIFSLKDFCLAITALVLLVFWKVPSWAVVLLCAVATSLSQV